LSEVITFTPNMTGVTSCLIVRLPPQSIPAVSAELQGNWNRAPGVQGAALFHSLGNDALVESVLWGGTSESLDQRNRALTDRILAAAPAAVVEVHALRLVRLTTGPGHRGAAPALNIESRSIRPVLVCVFDPIHRGRTALLQYLEEAGNRFATELKGWVSAALFCDNDREQVVEYLQFEGMEAVGVSQTSPIIQAHQIELKKFGNLAANLHMVDAVFRPN
jgi:hypothetical protein